MSSGNPFKARICAECGANNNVTAGQCWLCEASLTPATLAPARKPTAYERNAGFQFSIASLMLTMAIIAVLLGVIRMAPGLGIMVAIIVTPAWARTCITVALRSARNKPVSFGEELAIFAASTGIVVGIIIILIAAAIAAFSAFCGLMTAGDEFGLVMFAVFLGASFVVLTVAAVFWAVWKRSRQGKRNSLQK